MTMRLIERFEADGTRVEAGFFDDASHPAAARPEAPELSREERATLTPVDHAIGFAAIAAMLVSMAVIVGMFAALSQ